MAQAIRTDCQRGEIQTNCPHRRRGTMCSVIPKLAPEVGGRALNLQELLILWPRMTVGRAFETKVPGASRPLVVNVPVPSSTTHSVNDPLRGRRARGAPQGTIRSWPQPSAGVFSARWARSACVAGMSVAQIRLGRATLRHVGEAGRQCWGVLECCHRPRQYFASTVAFGVRPRHSE